MQDIYFANIEQIILFLIIPLIIFAVYYLHRKKKSSIRYSKIDILNSKKKSILTRLLDLPILLRLICLLLIILAIMRPQSRYKEEKVYTEGIDIVLAIDVSSSMRAEDFKPKNRLEAVKKVVKEFISSRSTDRIGLVVFAGRSYTQCPLTLDYGILLEFVDKLKIAMIEDGTAIGSAIATSVNRLKDSKAKSKVIILLTDGMNNKGNIDPVTAAHVANTFDIKCYTIGAGKRGGAPIPIMHPVFGKQYARNPDGSLVLTEMNEETLQEIANITNAKYFRATDTKKLKRIYEDISKMEKTEIEVKHYMRYSELFEWVLIPALILLIIEIVLVNTVLMKIP